MKIDIKYLDKEIDKLKKIEKGDLIDMRVSRVIINGEEVELPCTYKFGDTVFVKLGVAMRLPEGYKGNVYPRSGTFKNYGLLLTNSVGQIDNSYKGNEDEWSAMFWATREGRIEKNDRIVQFDISKATMGNIEFNETEILEETNRGGYSSTGVK